MSRISFVFIALASFTSQSCTPSAVEENMAERISAINEIVVEAERILNAANQDLKAGLAPQAVTKKHNEAMAAKFKAINLKLEEFVAYCDQERVPDQILDQYLTKVDVSKPKQLIADLKKEGVAFDLK